MKDFCFRDSLQLLIALLLLIAVMMMGLDAGPHMTLIACLILTGLTGRYLKQHSWATMESFMVRGVSQCLKAIFILGLIGALISAWMISGTIPTVFCYGVQVLSPEWFPVSALVICILVSSFTGSSLTTAGTVGVALMGIAEGFGISPELSAGAVICGACFGDKMSPLSDTTNFASGIAGVGLFTHIRCLLQTTLPALILTILAFSVLGGHSSSATGTAELTVRVLEDHFRISPLSLISPLIVVLLVFRKFPGLPVMTTGLLTAILTAIFLQGKHNPQELFSALTHGFSLQTESPLVNQLVSRGGLMSMMFSISLVMIALAFGGLLHGMGVTDALMQGLRRRVRSRGGLVLWATGSAIGINFLTGEQYLSILLPGQAFREAFRERGVGAKFLSRSLEDGGTLINPLVPWGVCGAFFSEALGVPVSGYLPYVFFLYLSPLFTIAFGFLQKEEKPAR
ncbi:MAG: Na+/H+ antiporter NhaC [Deltaproteobacteria bacterium]|nr:Na+/H+ antiporter NhaC [Deltaproteobacteria bacterium]